MSVQNSAAKAKIYFMKVSNNYNFDNNKMAHNVTDEEEEEKRFLEAMSVVKMMIAIQGINAPYLKAMEAMMTTQRKFDIQDSPRQKDEKVLRCAVIHALRHEVKLSDEEYKSLQILKIYRVLHKEDRNTSTMYISTGTRSDIGLIRSKAPNLQLGNKGLNFTEYIPTQMRERYSHVQGLAKVIRG